MGESTFKEAKFLHLDSTKSHNLIGWSPLLEFPETVKLTAEWYKAFTENPDCASQITNEQIDNYRRRLEKAGDR